MQSFGAHGIIPQRKRGFSYDKNSIPGNFTGYVRESDEAETTKLLAYTSLTSSQSLKWSSGNDFATPIALKTARVFKFKLDNGTALSDFNVYVTDPSVVSIIPTSTTANDGLECMLVVTGTKAGEATIVVTLAKDSSKYIDAKVTVA